MTQRITRSATESFFWAVKWNLVEAVLYQIIFIVHQTLFFYKAPRELFGLVGSLFGLIYVAVTFVVAGSDGALTPFFARFNLTKETFRSFLQLYAQRQLFIATLITIVCISFLYYAQQMQYVPAVYNQALLVLGLITLSESVKKIVRYLLQLCFENKAATLYELIGITVYVTLVWGWYFHAHNFSLMSIFLPFLISSTLVVTLIIHRLMMYANTLPQEKGTLVTQLPHELVRIQLLVMGNQLGRTLFSGNIIIPFFAWYAGVAQAGLASFANSVTHTATFFIQKLTVPPGAALLTRVQHEDQLKHHATFSTILSLIHWLVLISGLGMLVYGLIKRPLSQGLAFETVFLTIFFFFIHVLENVFMIYEKYFLIKDKTGLLVVLNGISFILCGLVWLLKVPFFVGIGICFCIRLALLYILNRLVFINKYL